MNPHTAKIVFYCKDCENLVDAHKIAKTYNYKCTACNGEKVAFGTEESISNFYKIKTSQKKD